MIRVCTLLSICLQLLGTDPATARITSGYSAIFSLDTVTAVADNNGTVAHYAMISSICPNPSNPRAVIAFNLAISGPADLSIFDLRGQLVRTLFQDNWPSGPHQVEWDGLDNDGHTVPAGSYFCRLATAQESVAKKLTIAR